MAATHPLVGLTVVVVLLCCVNAASKLPDDFTKCSVDDPKLEECLKAASIDAIRKMKNEARLRVPSTVVCSGKKSLGILPLDPLSVDEVVLDLGTGQAPFLFTARKVKVYGLTDSTIKTVKFTPDKFVLEFSSLTPNATFVFDYEATGRILLLPVNGNGPGSFYFTDLEGVHRLEGVPVTKEGRTYWNITKYDMKIDAKKLDIHLEGLLKGNKQVSEQLSEFLRREWRLFLDQLRGPSAVAFGEIFRDLANRIFSRVPYGDVFPGADKHKA